MSAAPEFCPKHNEPLQSALAHLAGGATKVIKVCSECSLEGSLTAPLYELVKALGQPKPLELLKTCPQLQNAKRWFDRTRKRALDMEELLRAAEKMIPVGTSTAELRAAIREFIH